MDAYQNCYGKFSAGGRKKSVVGIDRTHAIILPFDNDNIISVYYSLSGHSIVQLNLRLVYTYKPSRKFANSLVCQEVCILPR